MDNSFGNVFGGASSLSSGTTEELAKSLVSGNENGEVKEDPKEEVTHESLLAIMNDLAGGRLETDIPLDDPYWKARDEAVKFHVTPK